ncbi:hypothetical protein L915_11927 [Phytophthora nicotianae]|uniref:Uncharacterized protein n=1 Tax=Phytophthora nicotianae TaxID=4792 RepID=W2GIK6_PHYNI|nr:hypothetical protein L915_11927 [Phytophthora nicotianae]
MARYYREDGIPSYQNTSCVAMSNNSMLIFSGGKRIAGDTWSFQAPPAWLLLDTTEARQVYSVTMGKLSWELKDLSTLYDAPCTAKECRGIWALVNSSDANSSHLVLGGEGIPLQDMEYGPIAFSGSGDFWTYIVQLVSPSYYKSDVVLPRMFDHLNEDAEMMKQITGKNCCNEVDLCRPSCKKSSLYRGQPSNCVYRVCHRDRWADKVGQLTDARTVAEAIINDRKFPPWLLQMKLEHQQVSVPLEEFQIKQVELSRDNNNGDALKSPTKCKPYILHEVFLQTPVFLCHNCRDESTIKVNCIDLSKKTDDTEK